MLALCFIIIFNTFVAINSFHYGNNVIMKRHYNKITYLDLVQEMFKKCHYVNKAIHNNTNTCVIIPNSYKTIYQDSYMLDIWDYHNNVCMKKIEPFDVVKILMAIVFAMCMIFAF